jgi:ubiquinone/menaquinone biosynthesis C-methylase UbiE
MKFVIHHVDNVDFIMKEVKRLLKKDGIFLMIDHDSLSFADYMLTDIEHGLFINVYNKQIQTNNKLNDDIMVVRYYDWIEMNYLMDKYNFTYLEGDILSNNINKRVKPTRSFYSFYQINKK